MNIETLRQAEAKLRTSGSWVELAVADWFASVIDDPTATFNLINSEGYHALKVARAYLDVAA